MNSTVSSASWTILERTNQTAILKGYLDKDGLQCSVVNAMTVAKVPKRNTEIILVANNVTYIDDDTELESLLQPFQAMRHGVCFDMVPDVFGGTGSMTVDDEEIPFEYDHEKLFLQMRKPTKQDIDTLESFELTAPYSEGLFPRRRKQKLRPEDIPIEEWRKRLGYAPEEVVRQTLANTTQYYLTVECKERDTPRQHFKSRVPALRAK